MSMMDMIAMMDVFICPNLSIAHIKYVQFFVYQLYLNKAAKKKTLSFKCLYFNIVSGSVMPNSLKPFGL